MSMNVQCARGPAGVGAEGTQRTEGPAPQEAGAVPHLLCVCELLYNYRRPCVGSTYPHSMNPHTYKAMEVEEEEDKAVSSKTKTLSKTAVTQND